MLLLGSQNNNEEKRTPVALLFTRIPSHVVNIATSILVKEINFDAKTLLVNDKITASLQTNMSSTN